MDFFQTELHSLHSQLEHDRKQKFDYMQFEWEFSKTFTFWTNFMLMITPTLYNAHFALILLWHAVYSRRLGASVWYFKCHVLECLKGVFHQIIWRIDALFKPGNWRQINHYKRPEIYYRVNISLSGCSESLTWRSGIMISQTEGFNISDNIWGVLKQ